MASTFEGRSYFNAACRTIAIPSMGPLARPTVSVGTRNRRATLLVLHSHHEEYGE